MDSDQKLELSKALQSAFDPNDFDRMLHQRVDKKRYDIVGDQEFPEIVYQVIEAADRENWLAKLISGAKEANPNNAQLQAFLQKYPEYNPSNPPTQRENITGALRDAQIVLNENLVIFKNSFQNALDKIDVMSDYKVLHDELHTLTFAVFPNVVEASGLLPDGKDAKSNLSRYDKIIRSAIEKMREAAARRNVDEEESEWIEELDQSRKQLKAVLDDFDKQNLQSAIQSIQDILETQPTRINKELWRAMNSENDRLPELIDILEKVLTHMTKMTPPPSGIQQFQTGVESLKTLTVKLDDLIREHDTWQEVVG
ncbi:MAG TPA: effector-associated domain EAD1-containing protein, partial [Pyrinomonadaceae bacterium]|nr:effector-associated domain EAD1-containing protein [Pyrinomonadaceae bacterium]